MKEGQLVAWPKGSKTPGYEMIGFIISLDPFKDGRHTEVLWFDEQEPGGTIVSVWLNDDFELIGTPCKEEEQ
jgi:hypothetical protein